MLKKTRIKLFLTLFLSMFGIFAIFLLVLNLINDSDNSIMDETVMKDIFSYETGLVVEGGGESETRNAGIVGLSGGPRPDDGTAFNPEKMKVTVESSRYYFIQYSAGGDIIDLKSSILANEPEESFINSAVSHIVHARSDFGRYKGLKYGKFTASGKNFIVMLDADVLAQHTYRFRMTSLLLTAAAFIFFGLLSWFLSRLLVRPIQSMVEDQERFISDASHELKTPVSVINANISVLENEIGENKWLSYIKEEGSRMTAMINELLQLSKLNHEAKKKEFPKEDVDLSKTVIGTVLLFESKAYEAGVAIKTEIEEGFHIMADKADIEKITGILVDNAVRHSNPGGTVTVRLEKSIIKKYNCSMLVHNEGERISEEDKEHIFDRFYKGDRSRQNSTDTTPTYGLGLSIAKAIVEKYNGDIRVSSDDSGTKFIMHFPE